MFLLLHCLCVDSGLQVRIVTYLPSASELELCSSMFKNLPTLEAPGWLATDAALFQESVSTVIYFCSWKVELTAFLMKKRVCFFLKEFYF